MRFPKLFASASIVTVLLAVATSVGGTPTAEPIAVVGPITRADPARSIDPITRLQGMMDSGQVTLDHDTTTGYLQGLLRALKIPVSSQGFVFSRTSLQTDLIAPWAPRAMYFNDDVYVGFVQGSEFLEIATVSPTEGAVFYTLDQEPRARPAFKRDDTCLSCHKSSATGGMPGFLFLSSISDKSGYFLTRVHDGHSDDATPIRNRFGGWYVTGTINGGSHSGNVYYPKAFTDITDRSAAGKGLDFVGESQRTDLKPMFDTQHYLTPHSDLVALMVLVHETSVHNSIWRVHDAAIKALREDSAVSRYNKDTSFAQTKIITSPRLTRAVELLVKELLFVNAARFDGAMKGTSGFEKEFAALGPRDSKGRSLRDFDLKERLFRYPLSFLIYSEGFDAMPELARKAVYAQLQQILTGADTSGDYTGISAADRTAVLEILRETKPEFTRN